MNVELSAGRIYEVELCSGERRLWRCVGDDARGVRWWRDCESGAEFSESSLMYAWSVIGEAQPALPAAPD